MNAIDPVTAESVNAIVLSLAVTYLAFLCNAVPFKVLIALFNAVYASYNALLDAPIAFAAAPADEV